MHHICNFVRFCFNNNKNTTLKSTKKRKKIKKTFKKHVFLNFNKNIKKTFFYIYGTVKQGIHAQNTGIGFLI